MKSSVRGIAMMILLLSAWPASAQRVSQVVGQTRFSLELPAGYTLNTCSSPKQGLDACGFTTAVRADGTRGLILITIVDFKARPDETTPGTPTLDEFAGSMVDGIRRRRRDWHQEESDARVATVPARRIQWKGTAARPSGNVAGGTGNVAEGTSVNMRGVLYVGIAGSIGFALHTQDVEPYAQRSSARCEKAMLTFSLARAK